MPKVIFYNKDYQPPSLAIMQSLIHRYLRESNYEYPLLNSRLFKWSRNVLEGKYRLLREKRLEKKPNKTNSLTRQEEGILWKCNQLGDKIPKSYSFVAAHSTFWVTGGVKNITLWELKISLF